MMPRLFFLAFLMILIFAPAWAQESGWSRQDKPVICGPFVEIVAALTGADHQEVPLWTGQSSEDTTRFVLFVNPKNSSWTIIQHTRQVACVLGVGESGLTNLEPFVKH